MTYFLIEVCWTTPLDDLSKTVVTNDAYIEQSYLIIMALKIAYPCASLK